MPPTLTQSPLRKRANMNEFAITLASRSPELGLLVEQAARFLEAAKANSTRQAYARDWNDFRLFTGRHSLPFLPSTPEVVALYISDLATRLSVSTIRRRMSAITNAHKEAGFSNSPASPRQSYVVREVLAGIKRSLGTAQYGVSPLLISDIRKIVAETPDRLLFGLRDRALVLVGFSGAFRRSELATLLEVDDLNFTDHGLYIRMRRSKTDQEGQGRTVAMPTGEHPETCLIRALRTWLDAAGMLVVGVTLAPHGGQPAIKGVSDCDLAQLLGLFKLTQLPQLLFDGIPAISDLLCLALSFFPGPCLRRDCLVLTVSKQVNVLDAFATLPTGVVFLATLGRVAGVDGDGLGLRAEGASRRFVHVDRLALPSCKSLAVS